MAKWLVGAVLVLAACSGGSTGSSPGNGLTDAEAAWCPGYIPAIYQAGMRIGATPPPTLEIVQRIDQKAIAAGEDSDTMRYIVFTSNMTHDDQVALENEWKSASLDSYNRACKAAFASR